jgi:hypothetical protein
MGMISASCFHITGDGGYWRAEYEGLDVNLAGRLIPPTHPMFASEVWNDVRPPWPFHIMRDNDTGLIILHAQIWQQDVSVPGVQAFVRRAWRPGGEVTQSIVGSDHIPRKEDYDQLWPANQFLQHLSLMGRKSGTATYNSRDELEHVILKTLMYWAGEGQDIMQATQDKMAGQLGYGRSAFTRDLGRFHLNWRELKKVALRQLDEELRGTRHR